MKNILIIGGTGIIGKQIAIEAKKARCRVTTISLKKNEKLPQSVTQIVTNRKDRAKYKKIVSKLNQKQHWDAVIDVYNLGKEDAKQTHSLFYKNANHIITISTALVYDRSKKIKLPIKSSHKISKLGKLGGYVDNKIKLERYWQKVKNVPWTIFRPYHIIGPETLLGCLPMHNRDPLLLKRIKKEEPLKLCKKGNIPFNYIHPTDIAKIVLKTANNKKTFYKTYNAVNTTKIFVKEYYELIGKLLKKKVIIEDKPIKELWNEKNGWILTTIPHLYDATDLTKDIRFTAKTPLRVAMKDAIKTYPKPKKLSQIAIHKRMTLKPRPKLIRWSLN